MTSMDLYTITTRDVAYNIHTIIANNKGDVVVQLRLLRELNIYCDTFNNLLFLDAVRLFRRVSDDVIIAKTLVSMSSQ